MRVWAIASIFALVLCGSAAHGLQLSQSVHAAEHSQHPATTPVARDEPWWIERHQQIVSSLPRLRDTELLMIGDSITNNYDKAKPPDENFQPTWQRYYEPRRALNLGFSGDTTANVLWRIEHGEVNGLHPRAAVVLIGTNNTGWKQQTAVETEAGTDAVVKELRHRLPQMQILLLGILPSELAPSKVKADQDVNRYLAQHYANQPYVHYLDIGRIFFKDGRLDTTMFYDPRLQPPGHALHPDTNGQRKMAEAIEPLLSTLMRGAPKH
jgi:lysophospholipase L1-like esterase